MKPHPTTERDLLQLAQRCDLVADKRDVAIRSGVDLSYRKVLVPAIENLIEDCDKQHVLDAGAEQAF